MKPLSRISLSSDRDSAVSEAGLAQGERPDAGDAGSTARLTTGDYHPNARSAAARKTMPARPRDARPPSVPPMRFPDVAALKRLSKQLPPRPPSALVPAGRLGMELLLSPEQRRMEAVTEAFVETGELPVHNQELALALATGHAGLFGNLSGGDRRLGVVKWCLDVVNNDFRHPAARAGASAANIALRDFASVALTTVLRQAIGHYVAKAPGIDHAVMGYALGALPVVLQGAGQLVDRARQRDTMASSTSRALMALVSVGALAAAARTGQTAAAAPALFAFGTYALMRDMAQRFLQLKDQLPGLNIAATATSSVVYGFDQMWVNSAMTYAASPSGAGTRSLEPTNAVRRGAINWGGETIDDLVFGPIQAAWQKAPFQVRLSPQCPTPADLLDTFCRQFAARFTTFMTVVQLTQVFTASTDGKLSPEAQGNLADLLGAGMLAVLYNLFVNTLNTETRPSNPADPEAHPGFQAPGARQDRI